MFKAILPLMILLRMSVGQATELCQQLEQELVEPNIARLASEMTTSCTLLDVSNKKFGKPRNKSDSPYWLGVRRKHIDLPLYEKLTSSDLCSCINQNKALNEPKVPVERKDFFSKNQLDSSVGGALHLAMSDLYGNITKFKNLNLPNTGTNDLHELSKTLCSPDNLKKEIDDLQGTCPGAKDSFPLKFKAIFGTEKISEIPDKIRSSTDGADSNSCLSRHQYLHLMSSNTSAKFALDVFNRKEPFKDTLISRVDQAKLNDLLSYDLLFNLSYRDEEFREKVKNKIKLLNMPAADIYNDIYNDKDVLASAMTTLEGNCNDFKANIKTYLCTEGTPKVDALPLSLLVNDAVDNLPGHPIAKQAMRDHFTGQLACNPEPSLSPDEKKLNDYIQNAKLFEVNTFNPVADEQNSRFTRFNQTFCNGRKTASNNDLSEMMKEFFDSKKASNIDLNKFFADPLVRKSLSLSISTENNPFIVKDFSADPNSLPEITSSAWEQHRAQLIELGLNDIEVSQLYSIIEMQTNIRSREVHEVREKLIEKNPLLHIISPAEVDLLLRRATNFSPDDAEAEHQADATQIYQAQQDYRSERFNLSVNVQSNTGNTGPVIVEPLVVTGPEIKAAPDTEEPTIKKTFETKGLTVVNSSSSNQIAPNPGERRLPTSGNGNLSNSSISNNSSAGGVKSRASVDNPSSSSSSNTSVKNTSTSDKTKAMEEEISRIEEEIRQSRERYNRTSRLLKNAGSKIASENRNNQSSGASESISNPDYIYPRNVPFKTSDGNYYFPESEGTELSSLAKSDDGKSNNSEQRNKDRTGRGNADPIDGKSSLIQGSFGAGSGFSGGGRSAGLRRNPSSSETQSQQAPYEFYKYIPHSIFDVVGSIDKVVLLLGLEGQSFKTIEAIEEHDPATDKIKIRYVERTFDFVPLGAFEELKDEFSTKEKRIESFKSLFSYERTKENLKISKNYSMATKEIMKKEVPHSFVLKIQNFILSDEEIRNTINKAMELLK